MELKPQELLVLFKVAAHGTRKWTYAELGEALFLSTGEVHASVKRAQIAGLAATVQPNRWMPVRRALREFALHGARYAFPAIIGPVKRGVPTSYGTAPLAALINSSPDNLPVWPHPQGSVRGPSLSPIYRTAPQAALADPVLHEWLALLDAVRSGRARERELASKLLSQRLEDDILSAP